MNQTHSEDHASHERWLVSYADFITLLFAFFVVMFASSQVNKKKVAHIAAAFESYIKDGRVRQEESRPPPVPGMASRRTARLRFRRKKFPGWSSSRSNRLSSSSCKRKSGRASSLCRWSRAAWS